MNRLVDATATIATISMGLALMSSSIPAQARASMTPTAAELLARHARVARGGIDSGGHSTRYTRERIQIGSGITLLIERVQRRPAEVVTRATDPAGGLTLRGFTGTVAWEVNAQGSSRLLTGASADGERATARMDDYDLALPVSSGVTAVSEELFEGESAYALSIVPDKAAAAIPTWYFSKSSGLLVGQVVRTVGEQPRESLRIVLSNYADFRGVLIPTRRVTTQAGQTVVQVIEEVRWDSVPDTAFELPASIRALIKP